MLGMEFEIGGKSMTSRMLSQLWVDHDMTNATQVFFMLQEEGSGSHTRRTTPAA